MDRRADDNRRDGVHLMNYAKIIKVLYSAARVTPIFERDYHGLYIKTGGSYYKEATYLSKDVYGNRVQLIQDAINCAKSNGLYDPRKKK